MRILIINTDYRGFLADLYARDPLLATASFSEQMHARNESLFGGVDFYSKGFAIAGHEAWDIHANNAPMQLAWMAEHDLLPRPGIETALTKIADLPRLAWLRFKDRFPARHPRLVSPLLYETNLNKILLAQVRALEPDVVLNQSIAEVPNWLAREIKSRVKLMIGQIASPIPDNIDFEIYDAMLSSLPNFVEQFRQRGARADLVRLAFDPMVLERVQPGVRDVPVSFVGSITVSHRRRFDLLEYLAQHIEIDIWGRIDDPPMPVPANSPIRSRYHGQAWGTDMYRVLARSKITVNQHIEIAGGCANNMRLFEATGMGALLITDWKSDIGEMFEPGKEVVCYRDAEECADLIRYYLNHEEERVRIAQAGQARTLKDHSYGARAAQMASLFSDYMAPRTHR
jgi:hypothetical protein